MSPWTTRVAPLDAIALLDTLGAHGVEFVLVGGLAAVAHGYTGLTQDADATVKGLAFATIKMAPSRRQKRLKMSTFARENWSLGRHCNVRDRPV